MKPRILIVGMIVLLLMPMMVAAVSACDGLSPGYWKHNVKVYCGGPRHYSAPAEGTDHETDGSMEELADWILAGHSWGITIPSDVNTPHLFLEWANVRFQDNQYKRDWLTLANWFNAAAGYTLYSD